MPARQRLVAVAQRDTGQSEVCGRFLLGLYNGPYYRFDLTGVRRLDNDLLEDCLAVLRMDAKSVKEVRRLIENGDAVFRALRMAWATSAEVANWPEEDQAEWHSLRS